MVVISKYSQRADDQMTVACTQLRQELKEVPRAQKWALAHAGVNVRGYPEPTKVSMGLTV